MHSFSEQISVLVTAFYVVYCVQGRLMKNLTAHQVITASSLIAGALQAALIQSMIRKNIITDEEGHEIYEQALLMLETSQAVCPRCLKRLVN